jgi:hypothetical protein
MALKFNLLKFFTTYNTSVPSKIIKLIKNNTDIIRKYTQELLSKGPKKDIKSVIIIYIKFFNLKYIFFAINNLNKYLTIYHNERGC